MPEETTGQNLLPVFPLKEAVILPHMLATTAIDSDEARAAVQAAKQGDQLLLLVPKVEGRYAKVGTVARLEEAGRLPNGLEAAVLQGLHRGVLVSAASEAGGALWIRVEPAPDPEPESARAVELAREYRAVIENLLETRGAPGVIEMIRAIEGAGHLADMAGYSPDLTLEQKVEALETLDLEARLEKLIAWAKENLAAASLKDKIRSEVSDSMNKRQREFILRQQLEAIRKELGEEGEDVASEYRRRLAETPDMPEDVRKEVEREIGRLERMPEQNPEHGWIRTYLDTVFELPWGKRSEETFDIQEARRILDADHTGLDDVKERIIEFLAVRNRRRARNLQVVGRGSGAIITLVGPPGVGKTSLGESVARALGRKFTRVSLGGVHDEAEIRGHRRTYVGAMPGRIVRAIKEAGTMNPVIMLDEIDKVGSDWRGDPSSALLEVLDPAQNHSFRDHYLEVDLDLSDVLFIPTGNVSETIPGPLLDRMEVIRLDGYTEDEKLAIARDHLLRRQLERTGLDASEVELTDDAIRKVITEHTMEAGVRNLERQLGKALRKVATQLDSGQAEAPVRIDADNLREFLGRPRFQPEVAERTAVPGVATGLAVTGTGGDVLFIEAASLPGEGGLALTGQLGDVMKESAQIALNFVLGHQQELGLPEVARDRRYHIHVPAGAVPKDGPSAGVTMVTAITSLLSGRPVRGTVGMTGEVTLQGKVLPIGGVKQKLLAAHRAGLKEVILPRRNEPDLDDVPEAVREELTVHLVDDVAEVIRLALEPAATGTGTHQAA